MAKSTLTNALVLPKLAALENFIHIIFILTQFYTVKIDMHQI